MAKDVKIIQYKWAGNFWPFKIKTECGECNMSTGIINALVKDEYKNKPVTFEIRPWLNNWYKPLLFGGWHAPIILVNNHVVMQGKTIDKKILRDYINKQLKK